jgi:hypothetical protein
MKQCTLRSTTCLVRSGRAKWQRWLTPMRPTGPLKEDLLSLNVSTPNAFLNEVTELSSTDAQRRFVPMAFSEPLNESMLGEVKGSWTEYGTSLSSALSFDSHGCVSSPPHACLILTVVPARCTRYFHVKDACRRRSLRQPHTSSRSRMRFWVLIEVLPPSRLHGPPRP